MVNYGNGKIYKVVCSESGKVYIGSTTVTLSRRMTQHRAPSNNSMTKDFIDGKIFLIEDFPCGRKEQLESRERFHIESMECVNKCIPTRTRKEYNENNKEQIRQKLKEYQEKNKEQIRQQRKQYREKNKEAIKQKKGEKFDCDCGGKYSHCAKLRHIKTNKHQAYLSSIV